MWAEPPLEHPRLEDCSNEPLTAEALRKRRLDADMHAAEKEETPPRVSELDVWPVVVRLGIENTADDMTAAQQLQAWAKTSASHAMREFLFKHRSRLSALIDDIWRWERLDQSLTIARQCRFDALRAAAADTGCACHGR